MTRELVLAAWVAVALLLISSELISIASARRTTSVRSLLDGMTSGNTRFVLVFVGWVWIGWHFFAR
jgi:hypothetical protein